MLILLGIFGASGGRTSVAGYFGGGELGPGIGFITTVDKFAFPSESRSTLGTGLSTACADSAGFANSGVAGYVAGGTISGARITTVDKFAFPSDSRTTLGTGLSPATGIAAGFSNSGVAGYVAGGGTTVLRTDAVQKFTFPSDTRSTLGTGLLDPARFLAGMSNYSVAGYTGGGQNSTATMTLVDKFAFPSDTRSSSLSLSVATLMKAGMADQGVAGYFAGGANGTDDGSPRFATVDKFAFPSDTRTTLGTGLSIGRRHLGGNADSGVAGYLAGGSIFSGGSVVRQTTVDKFAFPSDTRSTLGTGLTAANERLSGMANEGAF